MDPAVWSAQELNKLLLPSDFRVPIFRPDSYMILFGWCEDGRATVTLHSNPNRIPDGVRSGCYHGAFTKARIVIL